MGSRRSGLPVLSAGGVTNGRVAPERKITGSVLDAWVWPVGGDVQGSPGVYAELSG